IDHYPHQFSGGMRQRVVIALALAAEPKLIVADEPTTALDVSIQAQIIQLLKRVCKDHGAAVMLITHDMGVIAETCDRVAVMYAGRVAEIGPVHEVINQPAHPYSMGLMAAIPDIATERERLNQIDGAMPRLDAIPPGCAYNPRCPRVFDPAWCSALTCSPPVRPARPAGFTMRMRRRRSHERSPRTGARPCQDIRRLRALAESRDRAAAAPNAARRGRRELRDRQGPHARARGRIRLRQEHRRALAGGLIRTHSWRPDFRRPGRP